MLVNHTDGSVAHLGDFQWTQVMFALKALALTQCFSIRFHYCFLKEPH